MATSDGASTLLLDEYADAGDERLLPELLKSGAQRKLAHLGHRLFTDSRPFARKVLLGYIDDGCDRPGHRALVKTLFKQAEAAADRELMAHFLVAFDRLVQRRRVTVWHYDWNTRQSNSVEVLRVPKGLLARLPRLVTDQQRTYLNPVTNKTTEVVRPHIPIEKRSRWENRAWRTSYEEGADPLRFTISTRRYLQRRCWRFFRRLGWKDSAAYGRAVRVALKAYRDEDLSTPETILDAWGLVHALYWRSPVLNRQPLGVEVAPSRSLKELEFAPFCSGGFTGCLDDVFALALHAQARPVRQFALWVLKTDYRAELATLAIGKVMPLLASPHEEVQEFGAEALGRVQGLETLPLADWLRLLKLENPSALTQVCELVKKHVAPGRLSLAQCVELACARPAPVAELGLAWTKEKPVRGAEELAVLMALRHAQAPGVRTAAVEWVAQLLLLDEKSRPELVRELLDAKHVEVRKVALDLMGKDRRFGDAVELWLAMSETPYADVREKLLEGLEARQKSLDTPALHRVWTTTLLSVHRGSRAKRRVARQVAERVVTHRDEAASLLTLLAHTLRSVRRTERRQALAQVVRAATADPTLEPLIAEKLPEFSLGPADVTR